MKRIIALVLTLVMVCGTLLLDVGAYAVPIIYQKDDKKNDTEEINYEETVKQYLTNKYVFKTAEDKLASMQLWLEKDGFQIWADELTGEIAVKNLASEQIMFSNPYDIAASETSPSESVKKQIMSQIIVRYTDNDTEKTMYSFSDAAQRGQIKIKNIKNGIRVEYSIGREETRMLVPKHINKDRFEEMILDPYAAEINKVSMEQGGTVLEWRDYYAISKRSQMTKDSGNNMWFDFTKMLAFYPIKSSANCETERERQSLYAAFPICKKMDIYVFDPYASNNDKLKMETLIKTYVPSYTYEALEYDHQLTEYEGTDKAPALFKLSLEYTLDEWGMSVRMPVNGLRFNESLYQLTYISILPYFGCGANYLLDEKTETFTGYNFFPDGSGTLFRHEDLTGIGTTTINGKIYGQDYAYNTITGSHQEVIRYPVFGIVSNYHDIREKTDRVLVSEATLDPVTGEVIVPEVYEDVKTKYTYEEDRGFVAIIEEGDALAELSTYHAGSTSKYNTVQMLFYPRPKDSYNLANAISVGSNASWTVVSSRKYVGNYKIRYIMLTDPAIAAEKKIEKSYETTWMGMAVAYRDYLYSKGDLNTLTTADVKEDIPVYIQTFGTLETVEKIMSIPVNVMTPLTSFDNIKTMYDELSDSGVSNIKFKLTGYANGGMESSIPYRLKWENAVGGGDGYADLLAYAAEKGFDVFPEFDFAYVRSSTNTLTDGLTLRKHMVKSINDTYMSKRYYSATRQTYMGNFELAVSPAYFNRFYSKLTTNLMKFYENGGIAKSISVSSLGTDLNSDFDEDEPYNREDSKKFTTNIFNQLSEQYDNVMTDGANAYTWRYIDYIVNVPLDSSRYIRSSASVPFIGAVLHGSIQFSGTPINMEGNIGYSMLKAIENGAGLYFTLAYQNYEALKEDRRLSQYYSVRYDILKEDVVKYYTLLNDLTRDLQLEKIVAHEFLIGERVPDPDEVIADAIAAEEELKKKAEEEAAAAEKEKINQLLSGRIYAVENATTALDKTKTYYQTALDYYTGGVHLDGEGNVTYTIGMKTLVELAKKTNADRKAAEADADAKDADYKAKNEALAVLAPAFNEAYAKLSSTENKAYVALMTAVTTAQTNLDKQLEALATAKTSYDEALAKTAEVSLAAVETALTDYNTKKAALDAITDPNAAGYANAKAAYDAALTKLNYVAGDAATAEAYVAAKAAAETADAALAAFDEAYLTTDEYKTLKAAADKAAGELETLEKSLMADTEKSEAYLAAKAAADAAQKTLADTQKETDEYTLAVKSAAAAADTLSRFSPIYEGSDEHKALIALVDSTAATLAAITDPITPEYKAALAASEKADADLEAAGKAYETDAAFIAASSKNDAAAKALSDYVEHYKATYKNGAEYKAAAAKAATADAALKTLTNKINAQAPGQDCAAEYLKLNDEKTAAAELLKTFTDPNSEEYKAAKAASDAATKAFNDMGTTIRSFDSTLYNAAYRYTGAITTTATRQDALDAAIKARDESPLKAQYDADEAAYNALLPAYQKAKDEADAAATARNDANKELSTLRSSETLYYRNVSSQVTRVANNILAQNSSVKSANKALADTALAMEILNADPQYNAEYKADLTASANTTATLVAEVNRLSALSITAAKASLEVADEIVDFTTVIVDPTAPVETDPTDPGNEGDKENGEEYEYTKYTDDSGSIVRVEYGNGVVFILNFNYFNITTVIGETEYTVSANGGIRINADGTNVNFTVK